LVAFFLYDYCIKRAWKVARLVKRIRRRIRRHSGNNPKLTK
ncbi:undecaprenyl-phosphate alpha-N-acetylglucosaminyl 1-phosphate transferase, partial [Pseudomonas aeruginosa]|nr:undecaprenyl-phosphate alpha-N-acetylglucosaminyl 1-phosphate transferase [Pseudomonas aeruginosa]